MTATSKPDLILGSRSPRRLELLSLLVSSERIRVVVPDDDTEAGFAGLTTLDAIHRQLANIARTKNDAVQQQMKDENWSAILTADTVVIATAVNGTTRVLGKPDGPNWKQTTRDWFENFYLGRTHQVATGVCLFSQDGQRQEFQGITEVRFTSVSSELVDWYIQTEEPLGKAGGYGLQGAGAIFVESIIGSPSNVIGLPIEQLWSALRNWELIDGLRKNAATSHI